MRLIGIKKIILTGAAGLALSVSMALVAVATPDEWLDGDRPYMGMQVEYAVDGPGLAANAGGQEVNAVVGKFDSEYSREYMRVHYTVQKGDTLIAVAARFGVSVKDMTLANNIKDSDFIREGQLLVIPDGLSVHTVAPGETISGIARNYGVTVHDICSVNGLRDENFIVAGKTLYIRKGGAVSGRDVFYQVPASLALSWPLVGWISSHFGIRDGRMHEGIDIAADYGTPIRAAMPGYVVFAGSRGTYGLTVILDHGNGLRTLYAHASRIEVSEGKWVSEGQVIALVGNTGNSRGPHLHMELLVNGSPCDPLPSLNYSKSRA